MVVPLTSQPAIGLPPHELVELYRQMLIIRRTEEQLARAHQQGLVHGACHTYVGEEAIAVGVCAHLRPDDTVFSTHRGHGHALAKGVPPRELIAELLDARLESRTAAVAACTCLHPRSACSAPAASWARAF